jgi:hypothetical protein
METETIVMDFNGHMVVSLAPQALKEFELEQDADSKEPLYSVELTLKEFSARAVRLVERNAAFDEDVGDVIMYMDPERPSPDGFLFGIGFPADHTQFVNLRVEFPKLLPGATLRNRLNAKYDKYFDPLIVSARLDSFPPKGAMYSGGQNIGLENVNNPGTLCGAIDYFPMRVAHDESVKR